MSSNRPGSPPADGLEAARRRGRRAAEEFDLSLRRREDLERENLLARRPAAPVDPPSGASDDVDTTVVRLQSEVEALTAFHRAVLDSKAWRFIQMLRRLVGRAW